MSVKTAPILATFVLSRTFIAKSADSEGFWMALLCLTSTTLSALRHLQLAMPVAMTNQHHIQLWNAPESTRRGHAATAMSQESSNGWMKCGHPS